MNRFLLFTSCFLILLSSCRKDEPDFPQDSGGEYQPVSRNSYWTYRYTDENGEEDIFTHTLTGRTDTIKGKAYREATIRYGLDLGDEKAYYRVDGTSYSLVAPNMTLNVALDDECEYLHSDAALNSSWQKEESQNLGGVAFSTRLKGTLRERLSSYKIGDEVFKDVVVTRVEMQLGVSGVFQTVSSAVYYVAKDIGIIKIVTNLDQSGETSTIELIDYRII